MPASTANTKDHTTAATVTVGILASHGKRASVRGTPSCCPGGTRPGAYGANASPAAGTQRAGTANQRAGTDSRTTPNLCDPKEPNARCKVAAFHTALKNARDSQQGAEGAVDQLRVPLEAANELYGNLSGLMKKYLKNRAQAAGFFDLDTLRQTGADEEEPPEESSSSSSSSSSS